MKHITSENNPLLKQIARLQRKPTAYRDEGVALLEGEHLLHEYLAANRVNDIVQLVVSDAVTEHFAVSDEKTVVVPQKLLEPLASGTHHAHVFALIHMPGSAAPSFTEPTVLLNAVQDAGNVGTIMRTAAAAGFTQLLLDAQCAAAYSPKVLRAAMGAHAHLQLHEHADLSAWLAHTSLNTLCADVHARDALYSVNAALPCAWLFGSEGQGVAVVLSAACRTKLRIPQKKVESLNVASAAAVCLYESVRQSL